MSTEPETPAPTFFGTAENVRQALSPEVSDVTDTKSLERWLYVATTLIKTRFTALDSLIARGKVKQENLDLVAEMAAERVARNPDGWRQFGIDNGNGTRDTVLSDGQVKILPNEWAMIYPDGANAYTQTAHSLTLGTPC